MILLAPFFLLGALAIGLPIVLHFLRRKPTTILRFPNLKFLNASLLKSTRLNSIRRWLVLLARCAIFALLALAFAKPLFSIPFSGTSKALMVVLDNSYSMGAGDQFTKSKAAALQSVRNLGAGDYAGLIIANGHPRIVVPLGHNIDQVITAITQTDLSYEANAYEDALRMADTQLAAAPCGNRELDWFGDNQYLAWSAVNFHKHLSPGVKLKIEPSEPRVIADVSVDDLKMLDQFQSAHQKMKLDIVVRNRSVQQQTRTLTVLLDHHEAASSNVIIPVGGPVHLTMEITPDSLEPIRGMVNLDPDDFHINDTRYFTLNPLVPLRVGIWPASSTGGADILRLAIAPEHDISSFIPVPIQTPDDIKSCEVLVIRPPMEGEKYDAQEAAMVAAVQQGKPCLIFADDGPESLDLLHQFGVNGVSRPSSDEPLYFGAIDFSRPELALFSNPGSGDLFRVRFSEPPQITGVESQAVLASFRDGSPAIVKTSSGQGHILLVCTGLNRDSTTWPFQSTFLPFVQESLKHLTKSNDVVDQILVGQPVPGQRIEGKSDEPGYISTLQGGVPNLVAVNVDAAESDLSPWTNELETRKLTANADAPVTIADLSQSHFEEVEQHQQIWWYSLLAVVSLLFLEMFLANRTPT